MEGCEAVICSGTQQLQSESMHAGDVCKRHVAAGSVWKNSVFVQAETADMKPAWRMLTNSCRAAPPYKCAAALLSFVRESGEDEKDSVKEAPGREGPPFCPSELPC